MGQEAFYCEKYFLENGLVCRFNGYWLWLADLHKWISRSWNPLLMDEVKIYPMAQSFFAVVFNNIEDKKTICEVRSCFWGSASLFM